MTNIVEKLDDIVSYWSDDYSIQQVGNNLILEIEEIDADDIPDLKYELSLENLALIDKGDGCYQVKPLSINLDKLNEVSSSFVVKESGE